LEDIDRFSCRDILSGQCLTEEARFSEGKLLNGRIYY